MWSISYCYNNVLPLIGMVAVESVGVGLNVIFKASSLEGLNFYVFIFYSSLISTLALLPLAFFRCRCTIHPLIQFPVFSRICILGFILVITQLASFKGVDYSSPTLASAISNLTLPFTFILAVILRMEKLDLNSSTTRVKIIGTLVSISGALMVVLYKGPKMGLTSSATSTLSVQSPNSNWIIGGVLFAIQYILYSVVYIVQAEVMQIFPAEIQVSFWICICSTLICAPICLYAEPHLDVWMLKPDIKLAAYAYSGLVAPFMFVIMLWCIQVKGPVYVASFKPLSIAIAAVLDVIFLGDTLHLGSVIGANIITLGFYGILWGKAKEEEETIEEISGLCSSGSTPLLQTHKSQHV